MSVESAKKFVEFWASDLFFRTQVEAAANADAKRKLVRDAGFDFDLADLSAVLPHSMGGELSDQEFEGVTGGGDRLIVPIVPAAAVAAAASAA